jgi:hypothetical protein
MLMYGPRRAGVEEMNLMKYFAGWNSDVRRKIGWNGCSSLLGGWSLSVELGTASQAEQLESSLSLKRPWMVSELSFGGFERLMRFFVCKSNAGLCKMVGLECHVIWSAIRYWPKGLSAVRFNASLSQIIRGVQNYAPTSNGREVFELEGVEKAASTAPSSIIVCEKEVRFWRAWSYMLENWLPKSKESNKSAGRSRFNHCFWADRPAAD